MKRHLLITIVAVLGLATPVAALAGVSHSSTGVSKVEKRDVSRHDSNSRDRFVVERWSRDTKSKSDSVSLDRHAKTGLSAHDASSPDTSPSKDGGFDR
jgi:hypothetical protein